MNQLIVSLNNNIRLALMKDNMLVLYEEFDYQNDTLDYIFSVGENKNLDKITFVLPTIFSTQLYKDAYAKEESKLSYISGYFCLSADLMEKCEVLAKALGVKNICFIERKNCFPLLKQTGVFVDYYRGDFLVYSFLNGKLLDFTKSSSVGINDHIRRMCLNYTITDIYNVAEYADVSLINEKLCNVQNIKEFTVLQGLTVLLAAESTDACLTSKQIRDSYLSNFSSLSKADDPAKIANVDDVSINTHNKLIKDSSDELFNVTEDSAINQDELQNEEKLTSKEKLKKKSIPKPKKQISSRRILTRLLMLVTIMSAGISGFLFYRGMIFANEVNRASNTLMLTKDKLAQQQEKYAVVQSFINNESDSKESFNIIENLCLTNKESKVKICNLNIKNNVVTLTLFAPKFENLQKVIDLAEKNYNNITYQDGDRNNDGLFIILQIELS